MTEAKRTQIYYDGTCRLCSGLIERIECSSHASDFEPIPIQRQLPVNTSFAEADRDMHTVDTDGRILKGADAVLYILSHYKRWCWLARLGGLPGFRQFVRLLYRIVADNRKRWFGTKEPA
jgi:predicted DCC family thiol-disulfide oxidoreductase YuxK